MYDASKGTGVHKVHIDGYSVRVSKLICMGCYLYGIL